MELISIIVPIYNVDAYLRESVESILAQTYQNIEVILVDDGSTDSSGKICDEYAAKDCRVRVVHKENGGVSTARNAGLDAARGEYIGFVDPDDYISPTMYGSMLSLFTNDDIGVVSCGLSFVNEVNTDLGHVNYFEPNSKSLVCHRDYLPFYAEHLSMVPINNVCSKLFKKYVIDGLRFVEGRNNEDAYFCYHLASALEQKKKNILFIPDKFYYYRLRPNSITQTEKEPLYVDIVKNLKEELDECRNRDLEVYARIKRSYIWHLNMCIRVMLKDKDIYDRYFNEIKPYLLNTSVKDFAEGYSSFAKYKVMVNVLLTKIRWYLAK